MPNQPKDKEWVGRFDEEFYHSDTCDSNKFAEQNSTLCICQLKDVKAFINKELTLLAQAFFDAVPKEEGEIEGGGILEESINKVIKIRNLKNTK